MGFRAVLHSPTDIQGPSQLVPGGIDVLSFSWHMENNIKAWAPSPSGTARVNDFSITKLVDTSSPSLYSMCVKGLKLDSLVLSLYQASGSDTPSEFATYTFLDCYITSVSPGGASGDSDGNYPTETVTFNFDNAMYSYGDANGGFEVGSGGITGQ